jgi:Na+(H+)/acetate symporter ActP
MNEVARGVMDILVFVAAILFAIALCVAVGWMLAGSTLS